MILQVVLSPTCHNYTSFGPQKGSSQGILLSTLFVTYSMTEDCTLLRIDGKVSGGSMFHIPYSILEWLSGFQCITSEPYNPKLHVNGRSPITLNYVWMVGTQNNAGIQGGSSDLSPGAPQTTGAQEMCVDDRMVCSMYAYMSYVCMYVCMYIYI